MITCALVWINNNLGTLLGVVAASIFAYYQYQINKRQYLLSKSQPYIDSSIELSIFANENLTLIKDSLYGDPEIIQSACKTIDKIYFNAELYLSPDIVDYIEPLRESLKLIRYYYDNYLYCKSVIQKLESDRNLSINFRKEVMYFDGTAYYNIDSNNDRTVTYLDIPNLKLYCEQQMTLANERSITINTELSLGKYNAYNINKIYKKYTAIK